MALPGGRRRDGRLRAELAATLATLTGKLQLSICDLSTAGARLRPHCEVKVGTQGVLTWLEFDAFGEVVWHNKGFVGVKFDQPIRPTVIFQTRRACEAGLAPSEDQIGDARAADWFRNFR